MTVDQKGYHPKPTLERYLTMLTEFVQKYGTDELPMYRDEASEDERALAQWRYSIYRQEREGKLTEEERQDIVKIHPMFFDGTNSFTKRDFKQIIDDIAAFHAEHERMPQQTEDADEEEVYQAITVSRYRRKYHNNELTDEQVKYIQDTLPAFFEQKYRKRVSQEERLRQLEEWYKHNTHRPRVYVEEESELARWVNNQLTTPPAKSEKINARRRRVAELVGVTRRDDPDAA